MIKSSSFKVLPQSLAEVFQLECNLKFTTIQSFSKVTDILSVCLASLVPLSVPEIYSAVSALKKEPDSNWQDFVTRFNMLSGKKYFVTKKGADNLRKSQSIGDQSTGLRFAPNINFRRFHGSYYDCILRFMFAGFLVRRGDDTVMFYHPLFRDWLIRRKDNESTKFMVDPRNGHLAMALTSSRNDPKDLTSDKILDLCHHMLKAHVFRNHQTLSRDLQSVSTQKKAHYLKRRIEN